MTESNNSRELANKTSYVTNGNGKTTQETPKKPSRLSKGHAAVERPNRKSVPTLETIKISDGPEVFRNPTLIMTAPSVDEGDLEEELFAAGTVFERPTEFEPRTRRVSDVIDSSGDGNSLPNSPRRATFNEQFLKNAPITTQSAVPFLPDWLNKPRLNDSTDSAPLTNRGAGDQIDAAPMNSSSTYPDEDDDNMPRDVVADMPVEKDSHEYNMSHGRRGRAVIFNHDEFEEGIGFGSRPGSELDAKNLEKTFSALGFQVSVHHNLTSSEIMAIINGLKEEDHSDADCLMITILSHGMTNGYVLSKDAPYSVERIWLAFKADVCPTLAGKPKMFFIQACRGTKLDPGVHMMRRQSRTQTDSAASDYKIPSHADFLIAFSTVDGHYAWRNPEMGTWFIQCLCRELGDSGTTVDLLKLMTRTARRVALDYESFNDMVPWQHEMKQVPSITSMLIRDVFFRPKAATAMEVDSAITAVGSDV